MKLNKTSMDEVSASTMDPYQIYSVRTFGRKDNAAYELVGGSPPPRPDSGCSTASGEEWTDGDSTKSSEFYKDQASPVLKEQLFTIGNSAPVTVCRVEGPGKFWCQLSQNANRLKNLMEDLQIFYARNRPVAPSGSACVVRHPDSGLWHRGNVVKLQSFPYVEVQFVDYGQTHRVMHQDLRPLDSSFATLQCQAFQCRLIDVKRPSSLISPEWGEAAVSKFCTFVQSAGSSGLTCTIYGVMYDPEGVVINLVDLTTSFPLDECHSASASISEKSSEYIAPELKVGSEEQILITCVKDVHSFYGQLVRHASEIDKLNEEIQSFCCQQQVQGSSKCSFIPGAPCFAKYTDGQWYRGLVKKTQPVVMVHFLDYGDIVPVKSSDLRPVPDEAREIMSVPNQVLEFNLANAPTDTSTEVNKWFDNNATGKHFTVKVSGKYPDGKCTVELFEGKLNINQAVQEKIWKTGCGPLRAPRHSRPPTSYDSFALINSEAFVPRVSPMGICTSQPTDSSSRSGRGTFSGNENNQYDGTSSGTFPTHQKFEKPSNTPTQHEGVSVCALTPSYYACTAEPLQTHSTVFERGVCNSPGLYKTSFPMLANLPHPPITPGLVTEVYISHVNSLDSLFVQLLQDEDKTHSLVTELNAGQPCADPVDLVTLREGDVVAAMFPEDDCWYRAAVKKVNEDDSILVEFIDFGNRATITSNMIRHLKKFLQTPRLSVHCSFEDVDDVGVVKTPDETTKQLESIARAEELKRMTCMFINWTGLVWRIAFLDPETKQRRSLSCLDGTSPLSSGNHHTTNTAVASTSSTPCPPQPSSAHLDYLADLPRKGIRQGVLTDVYICHVNSTDSFFVQLAEDGDSIGCLVEEMNQANQTCNQPHVSARSLQVGVVVAAMFPEDESWYRAVVKKVNHDDDESVLVEFIDFGNEVTVSSSLLRTLTKRQLDVPRLCVECRVDFGNGCLNTTSKEDLTAKLRAYTQGDGERLSCLFAAQFDHFWEVIFEEPCSAALESNPVDFPRTADMANCNCQDHATDISSLSKLSLELFPKLRDLPPNAITPGLAAEVYVSHVNSQTSFYVQLIKDEDAVQSLVERLNSANPCNGPESASALQEGDVVGAMFPEDDSWYRAVVKKVNEDDSVLVEFIDFGNEATVTSSKITYLEKSFLNVPKFSVHCRLRGGSSLTADELMAMCNEALDGNPRKIGCLFIRETDGDVWEIQNL
ncbi:tudor domain-containing 6 [Engraulis encrasicolus]|uniref:tudor domain-containing 6 n=1 Tax=Engraulis encrasicolus TaxID=184585 RepID=UPI002FD4E1B8